MSSIRCSNSPRPTRESEPRYPRSPREDDRIRCARLVGFATGEKLRMDPPAERPWEDAPQGSRGRRSRQPVSTRFESHPGRERGCGHPLPHRVRSCIGFESARRDGHPDCARYDCHRRRSGCRFRIRMRGDPASLPACDEPLRVHPPSGVSRAPDVRRSHCARRRSIGNAADRQAIGPFSGGTSVHSDPSSAGAGQRQRDVTLRPARSILEHERPRAEWPDAFRQVKHTEEGAHLSAGSSVPHRYYDLEGH